MHSTRMTHARSARSTAEMRWPAMCAHACSVRWVDAMGDTSKGTARMHTLGDGISLVSDLANGASLVGDCDSGNDCHGNGSFVGDMPRNTGRPPGGDGVTLVRASIDASSGGDDVSLIGISIIGSDGGGHDSATGLILDLGALIGGSPSTGACTLAAHANVSHLHGSCAPRATGSCASRAASPGDDSARPPGQCECIGSCKLEQGGLSTSLAL